MAKIRTSMCHIERNCAQSAKIFTDTQSCRTIIFSSLHTSI